jgi:tRNA(Ile)-lysidine synthase
VLSQILRTIDEHRMVAPGERVLLAVSGGPDSTALLHAMAKLAPRLGVALEAASIDHGLRAEAADEARLVAERCRALGVPCEVVRVDVRAARGRHVSWQDAARRARLEALERLAGARGCSRVALGHTADDQAETLLFRVVRGTGLLGLAGIPYVRGPFVRPLLDVRRREVLRFLERRRIPFLQDPSNQDRRFARSRVRHEWIPFLSAENPRLVEALLALAAEARALEAGARVDRSSPVGRAGPVGRRAAETVRRLSLRAQGTRRVSVPGGELEVRYGRVSFLPRGPGEERGHRQGAAAAVMEIRGPGVYPVTWEGQDGRRFVALELQERESIAGPPATEATFDRAYLAQPLVLRQPLPGDRMRPRGGRGSKKLSDLLVDAKIARPLRAQLPVLATAGGTVLFVPGLRPSEEGRPAPGARRWLQVGVR